MYTWDGHAYCTDIGKMCLSFMMNVKLVFFFMHTELYLFVFKFYFNNQDDCFLVLILFN